MVDWRLEMKRMGVVMVVNMSVVMVHWVWGSLIMSLIPREIPCEFGFG